jgi:hypothetical protein
MEPNLPDWLMEGLLYIFFISRFVGKDIATSALNGGLLIKEEHVET